MLFDDAQSYTAFRANCRLSQSVTSPTPEYNIVSSAKVTSLDVDTSLLISKIIIKNRRGPKKMGSVSQEAKQPNTNISRYPNCSELMQMDVMVHQKHLRNKDTPCRQMSYYITCAYYFQKHPTKLIDSNDQV